MSLFFGTNWSSRGLTNQVDQPINHSNQSIQSNRSTNEINQPIKSINPSNQSTIQINQPNQINQPIKSTNQAIDQANQSNQSSRSQFYQKEKCVFIPTSRGSLRREKIDNSIYFRFSGCHPEPWRQTLLTTRKRQIHFPHIQASARSRERCVINGQTIKTSDKRVRPHGSVPQPRDRRAARLLMTASRSVSMLAVSRFGWFGC